MTIPHKLPITLTLAASFATGCVPHRVYNERPDRYIQSVTARDAETVRADLTIIEIYRTDIETWITRSAPVDER